MNDQMRMNLQLHQTTEITCDECKHKVFEEKLLMRKASRFVTGGGQDALIPIPVFVCSNCGHINEEFLPLEMKKQKGNDDL